MKITTSSEISARISYCEEPETDYIPLNDLRTFLADCLKPVPVGEACKYVDAANGQLFFCDGEYACKSGADSPYTGHKDAWIFNPKGAEKITLFAPDTIVQPVRLVPALEAMEGRNDG